MNRIRMTTFIKRSLKNQMIRRILTNIAANITEHHIISNLIFLRIIIPKLRISRQLIQKLTWTYGLFGQNDRVAFLHCT